MHAVSMADLWVLLAVCQKCYRAMCSPAAHRVTLYITLWLHCACSQACRAIYKRHYRSPYDVGNIGTARYSQTTNALQLLTKYNLWPVRMFRQLIYHLQEADQRISYSRTYVSATNIPSSGGRPKNHNHSRHPTTHIQHHNKSTYAANDIKMCTSI
jgi:hypothetical protein